MGTPLPLQEKGARSIPNFPMYCSQTDAWIKMPLGTGSSAHAILFYMRTQLPPKKGHAPPNEGKEAKPVKICWGAPNWCQLLVGRSLPYCGDVWRRYCCLTSFFPIVDTCLSCEDTGQQACAIVRTRRFLRHFCVLYFQRATCNTFQTCILNSH